MSGPVSTVEAPLGEPRTKILAPYAIAAAAVAGVFIVVSAIYGHPVLPIDDGYTTLHDAQVLMLHGGHDPNYAGVSPLNGETSLVHLGLLALLVPVGGEWASYLLSWLAILAYVLGVVRLARLFKVGSGLTAGVVAVALLSGVVGYQLLNGMETGLAMATVVWLLALAIERRHIVWLGLLSGVAPFVRPELGLLAGLLIVAVGWQLVRGGEYQRTLILVGAALLGAAPWVVWSYVATGHLLPTTVSAKAAWFAEQGLPKRTKLHYTRVSVGHFASQLGPLLLGVPFLAAFFLGRVALLFTLAFYGVYFYRYSSELDFYFNRYQYVLFPFLLLGLVWLLARTSVAWRRVGLSIGAASLIFALATFSGHWADWTKSRNFTTTQLRPVAQWANQHIPRDSVVMIHDAGYIAFATKLHLVDLVGLKTPAAVEINQRDIAAETDWTGRAAALDSLARLKRPQYLVVLKGWDFDFGITKALRTEGWQLTLLRNVERGDGYQVYAMSLTPTER